MSSESVEPAIAYPRTSPRIPQEITLEILEIASSDMPTLLTICLVSKYYCQFFRPLLQQSLRFRSREAIDAFKNVNFDMSLVQDIFFLFTESFWLSKVYREDFEGCSELRALALIDTEPEDPLHVVKHRWSSFESITRMLMPKHLLLGYMLWGYGHPDPSLRSVTHLTFTLADRSSSLELSQFLSLTHVCIRIDMRQWYSEFGYNMRDGFPLLEQRGVNILVSIHHFLPIPEFMVIRLIRRYVDPYNSLTRLKIKVEPDEALDLHRLEWHDVLQRHFQD
ncbi:hypothetical protein SISNIDRAFT_490323 [Sistotremastrum niveocremeum HHB9708]|uniref:F-box domain-containing protein n=1 Tax=Sistotremastrum niveocremeum HHB9708 TaxID=1314777 RepID=A0A164P390_9AGAM|nr:hypothetical protein SISNIDRAFT_490323 [Sistotremastrum niveocremeum HHB9708]